MFRKKVSLRKKKELYKTKKKVQELSDTIRKPNMCILGVTKGMEKQNGLKGVLNEITHLTTIQKRGMQEQKCSES